MSGRVGSITTGIISDGLIFNMDPSNRASYVPNASTTFNTIDSSLSGSLINGTAFTENPKVWSFDGVDDMIPLNSSVNMGQAGSLSFWLKRDNQTGTIMGEPSYTFKYVVYINGTVITLRCGSNYRSFTAGASTTALNTTDWVHIVFTRDVSITDLKFYVDGTLTQTHTTFNSNDFLLGGIGGVPSMTFAGIECEIGAVHAYNRVLSANEVLHNYNALKNRFV